ncbi:unnamed protein product [Oikopleura dioica]|uniref:MoaB/Mog domain-containing protein n=1 Tax=Oikopleura dioica TaxID=34765 RepID=E4XI79_OIKDI|nr:unnamed protein product [Oikopleura dioica]
MSHSPLNGECVEFKIVPDEQDEIEQILRIWSDVNKVDLILTSGGTGFSKRDVTPEATRNVIEKEANGMVIAMMQYSLTKTPMAMLSRAVAGIRGTTLIINLPGSSKGALECFESVAGQIPHAIDLLQNSANCAEIQSKMNGLAFSPSPELKISSPVKIKQTGHVCPHKKKKSVNFKKTTITDNPARRDRKSPWPMLSVQEALRLIFENSQKVSSEEIDCRKAMGRIISDKIEARVPLPPFPASIKDGYAVRSTDGGGIRKLLTSVAAGDARDDIFVASGYVARINTGAPLPKGADAVVQVEDTNVISMDDDGEETEVSVTAVPAGNDIRPIGSDVSAGDDLLFPGDRLNPSKIGLLCTTGNRLIKVYRKLKIVVFSTGSEVVELDQVELKHGQIYDANRYTLIGFLNNLGYCDVIDGGILPDQPQTCLDAFQSALEDEVDMIITSGGVSMGDKDYIKSIITNDLGGKLQFGRVNMKPGKPTTFGTIGSTLFFGLPGNPSSSAVTFNLFVKPALRIMTGQNPRPKVVKVKLAQEIVFDGRPEYHRCILDYSRESELPLAVSTGSQCSANIQSMARANALIIVPQFSEAKESYTSGEIASAMLIDDF